MNEAERQIAAAFPSGSLVDLPLDDSKRNVRAELLAFLLVGGLSSMPPGARPALRLRGARIVGTLDLEGATLVAPVLLAQCLFESSPNFADADAVTLRMPGCHTPGFFGPDLQTRGDLELNDGFICSGEVDLVGAKVGGSLRLNDATLHNPDGKALKLSRAQVEGGVFAARLWACGQLRMISAKIGGLLSLKGADIWYPSGAALQCERVTVGESVFFQPGFTCNGWILFQNARVGGGVDGFGATFNNPGKTCLTIARSHVERNVSLRSATLEGRVRIVQTSVGGIANFEGAIFAGPAGQQTLDLEQLRAGRAGLLFDTPPHALVLKHADIEVIDDRPAVWPSEIELGGCTYRTVQSEDPIDVTERLTWIRRHSSGYSPQPYQQLAAAYRAEGHDSDVRAILMAQRRDQLRLGALTRLPDRWWTWLTGALLGYGYQPWRALLYLLGVLAVSVALAVVLGGQGALARAEMPAAARSPADTNSSAPVPCTLVQTIGKGLDLGTPFLSVSGTAGRCETTTSAAGDALTVSRWLLQLAAWALAALFIAGFTGIVRKT